MAMNTLYVFVRYGHLQLVNESTSAQLSMHCGCHWQWHL